MSPGYFTYRQPVASWDRTVAEPFVIEHVDHAGRAIPPSRSGHTRGWHPVRPGHGAIPFESGLERKVIDALISHASLTAIRSQPLTVFYRLGGKARRYTPDFVVQFDAVPTALSILGFGATTYLEVKPHTKTVEHMDELLQRLAVIEAATRAPAVLVTERDLHTLSKWGQR